MKKLVAVLAVSVLAMSGIEASAQTRSTGWITVAKWHQMAGSLSESTGEIPVAIKCRDGDSKSLSNNAAYVNVTIRKNTGDVRWSAAIGEPFGVMKPRLERAGLKMVSYDEYRRSSGLKVRCGIWHTQ